MCQTIQLNSLPKVFGFSDIQIDCNFNVTAISDTFTKPLTYNWDKHKFSIHVQQDMGRLLVL